MKIPYSKLILFVLLIVGCLNNKIANVSSLLVDIVIIDDDYEIWLSTMEVKQQIIFTNLL